VLTFKKKSVAKRLNVTLTIAQFGLNPSYPARFLTFTFPGYLKYD
jgi:hypothetical protein